MAPPDTSQTGLADTLDGLHREISDLFGHVSDPDADRGEILGHLLQRLAVHASAEKQHLSPALAGVDDGEEAATTMDKANQDMERLLVNIERRSLTSPDLPDMVTELLAEFDAHLEQYRRQVEPLLRDGPLAGNSELADAVAEIVDDDDAHPHPLLPNSGPLGKIGRAVASAIDTTRNKTVDRN